MQLNRQIKITFYQAIVLLVVILASGMSLGGEKAGIGLTTRLNRAQIKEYLANVHNLPREQLLKDLESVGFTLRDESPTGLFKLYEDKAGNLRVKIHPPDPNTPYSHIHIYDKSGRSLTTDLTRSSFRSREVHIRIDPIQAELEWRPKK